MHFLWNNMTLCCLLFSWWMIWTVCMLAVRCVHHIQFDTLSEWLMHCYVYLLSIALVELASSLIHILSKCAYYTVFTLAVWTIWHLSVTLLQMSLVCRMWRRSIPLFSYRCICFLLKAKKMVRKWNECFVRRSVFNFQWSLHCKTFKNIN